MNAACVGIRNFFYNYLKKEQATDPKIYEWYVGVFHSRQSELQRCPVTLHLIIRYRKCGCFRIVLHNIFNTSLTVLNQLQCSSLVSLV